MDSTPEIDLTAEQANAIARGLATVARCDGQMDVREISLIGELTNGSADDLHDIDAKEVAQVLGGPAATTFLKSCLLVALADQTWSEPERRLITGYSDALGVSRKDLDALAQSVKQFLLSPLVKLANVDAVAELGKKLGV